MGSDVQAKCLTGVASLALEDVRSTVHILDVVPVLSHKLHGDYLAPWSSCVMYASLQGQGPC